MIELTIHGNEFYPLRDGADIENVRDPFRLSHQGRLTLPREGTLSQRALNEAQHGAGEIS